MSDPSAPGNPYGEPANSYGQAPQPPTYGQPPAYGQQPEYGQLPAYGQPPDVDKRPGTVTAAAVITLVFSALSVVLFAIAIVALSVERDSFLEEVEGEPGLEDISPDDLFAVMMVLLGAFLLWSLVAIVLAVLVMRRSNVARILLIISAAMTALVSLLAILSAVSVVPLAAGIAVIVLLLTGRARDWFARKGQPPQLPLGTTQPWS